MSDKDEFTQRFHDMRTQMVPSPDLVARLTTAIETHEAPKIAAGGPVAAHPVASAPKTPRKTSNSGSRRARRLGLLSGSVTSLALAGFMLVGGISLPGTDTAGEPSVWPSPITVSGSGSVGLEDSPGSVLGPEAYAQIYAALASSAQNRYTDYGGSWETASDVAMPTSGGARDGATSYDMSLSSYSGTNTQVAGIDEGDVVKTDGEYIYIAHSRSVRVVVADGAGSHEVAIIDIASLASGDEILIGPVVDMMIDGDTLAVLAHGFSPDLDGWSSQAGSYASFEATDLKVAFYDISDPAQPRYLSQVSQSGTYSASRLLDGVLYLVSTYMVMPEGVDPNDPQTYVPCVGASARCVPVRPLDVHILPIVTAPMYSLVTAVNVSTRAVLSEQAVLGSSETVYMSDSNLYLAGTQWGYGVDGAETGEALTIPGLDQTYAGGSSTEIVRISLGAGSLAVAAETVVPGRLLDQFALDESADHLRVVTTWEDNSKADMWVQKPALWVLDSSLSVVGSIPELVTDESVQSVRFDGDVAYVVTFRQVDPLFTIDVSNPAAPEVKSALKIPGFSTYLHPFGDGLLLGVGVDVADPDSPDGVVSDATKGQRRGLKLSMFDISDPYNVREVSTALIDADDTEVSYDHKAAFVDVERGLIGFPTMAWDYETGATSMAYRVYTWGDGQFSPKATLELAPPEARYSDGVVRGMRVEDDFYVVTSGLVRVFEMGGYSELAEVKLS